MATVVLLRFSGKQRTEHTSPRATWGSRAYSRGRLRVVEQDRFARSRHVVDDRGREPEAHRRSVRERHRLQHGHRATLHRLAALDHPLPAALDDQVAEPRTGALDQSDISWGIKRSSLISLEMARDALRR